jgi:hypothetical protein
MDAGPEVATLCIGWTFVLDLLGGTIVEATERLNVVLCTVWVLALEPGKETLCSETLGRERVVLLSRKGDDIIVEEAGRESELEWDVYNVSVTLMDVPETLIDIEILPRSELLSKVGTD